MQTERATIKRNFLEGIGYFLLMFTLFGGLVADAASIWLYSAGSEFWRISLIIRAASLFSSLVLVLAMRKPGTSFFGPILAGYLLSTIVLWAGFIIDPWYEFGFYAETSLIMVKFIFSFFIYLLVMELGERREVLLKIGRSLDITFAIYIFFILAGVVSGNEMLRSYEDARPGYKGIIYAQNEATGFMLVSIAWFFMRMMRGYRTWLWFGTALLAGIFVGTKGLLLGIPFMLVCLGYATFGMKRTVLAVLVLTPLMGLAANWSYDNVEEVANVVNAFIQKMTFHYIHHSNESLISILVSGRDMNVSVLLDEIMNRAPWAWLVGGVPIGGQSSESDLFEIAAAFGVPFLGVYLACYWHLLTGGTRELPWHRRFLVGFGSTWLIVAFTGGHILNSGLCAPFLAILLAFTKLEHAKPSADIGTEGEPPAQLAS